MTARQENPINTLEITEEKHRISITPFDEFTFTYSSCIIFLLYLLLEVSISYVCNDLIMQQIMGCCSQTLVMTP